MNPATTWLSDIEKKTYPKLDKDIATDVVIVGAGLTGSMAAYFLSKEGKKVVLIDKGDIESATTSYTTAWITAELDTDFSTLATIFGEEKMKALFNSGNTAIDMFEKIINEEKIDCEFMRVPVYRYASTYEETRKLEKEYQVIQKAGLPIALHKAVLPGFNNIESLEIPNQAKFHPLKFLQAIQEASVRYGAQIFHNTEALSIEGDVPVVVKTKEGEITAEYSIMATYQPFQNPRELFGKKGMYKSYVFEGQIEKGLIKEGLYLDAKNPYHYFRIDQKSEYDRIIIGGEDHRSEIPINEEKNFKVLKDFLEQLVQGKEYKIVRKWTGNILESVDGLPFIGMFSKEHPHQLVATAYSGNGIHFSLIAGEIFRDIILKRENSNRELYDAGRGVSGYATFRKAIDSTKEFFGGAFKNFFK